MERENIVFNKLHIYYEKNQGITNDSEASFASNLFIVDYTSLGINTKFSWLENNNYAYGFTDYVRLYVDFIEDAYSYTKQENMIKLKKLLKKSSENYYKHKKNHFSLSNIGKSLYKKLAYRMKDNSFLRKVYYSHPFLMRINHKILGITKNQLFNNNKIQVLNKRGKLVDVNYVDNYSITINGHGNTVIIKTTQNVSNCHIFVDGDNNYIEIGENAHCLANVIIFAGNQYSNRRLLIGNNAMIMGARIFVEENGGSVIIGDNVTFSDEILIQNSDGHVILDNDGNIINAAKEGIIIEDHVWIGRRATILKDVHIEKDCIIGSGALVTRGRYISNACYGGNPAKLIKKDINFSRDLFNQRIYEGDF